MEKPIIKDVLLLGKKARPAVMSDRSVADDLIDTLLANRERCVGMAANMIGVPVSIIVYTDQNRIEEMWNPQILKQSGAYETEEGCLSHEGTRPVKRYRSIKVSWQTRDGKPRIKTFLGFTAQIIQHEIDHLNGILI